MDAERAKERTNERARQIRQKFAEAKGSQGDKFDSYYYVRSRVSATGAVALGRVLQRGEQMIMMMMMMIAVVAAVVDDEGISNNCAPLSCRNDIITECHH